MAPSRKQAGSKTRTEREKITKSGPSKSKKRGRNEQERKRQQEKATAALKKTTRGPSTSSCVWTFDERTRLAEAVESEQGVRSCYFVKKYVGTSKDTKQINNFQKYYQLVEQGAAFAEFKDKAPLDAWIELAAKTGRSEDKSAEQCIPQLMTVAAFEHKPAQQQSSSTPNYANIYTFLSEVLRGGDPPDLPPIDAHLALNLLDSTVDKLASSITMLQKEFLHQAFSVFRKSGTNKTADGQQEVKSYPSLNPLNIPANLLEFNKKQPITLDLGENWRTPQKDIMKLE